MSATGTYPELAPATDSGEWQSYEEAVADLFVLVDLVPDHQLDSLVPGGHRP